MIKNLRRKGFTIVELVIVIAVIAILAAILIPTFSGIIKKANIASDTAMAKNMNTALVMADSEGNKAENMGEVLFTLYEAGYVLENLNPTTNGYYFVWDQESNQILFLTDNFDVHYSSKEYIDTPAGRLKWWLPFDKATDIIDTIDAKLSYCMAADITVEEPATHPIAFDYLANFDTNGFTLKANLEYNVPNQNGDNKLRVSGIIEGTLTINAPFATVSHYGAVENVVITEVDKASYHEYGFVKVKLELSKGRLVIENSGNATEVVLPVDGADVSAENKGYINTLNSLGVVLVNNAGYIKDISVTGTQPGGENNQDYVILIENLKQLEYFRDAVNSGMTCKDLTVKLTQDIDLSNKYWKPIGFNNKVLANRQIVEQKDVGPANVFMGTFHGNGKTIKGITNKGYTAPGDLFWQNVGNVNGYAYGLFSVTFNAKIQDLTLTNVDIVSTSTKSACVGAIIGAVRGDITMDDCFVYGKICGTDGVGGAIGYVYNVESSESTPDDTRDSKVILHNVYVNADILAETNGTSRSLRAGGIIGTLLMKDIYGSIENINPKVEITGCTFIGNVSADEQRVAGLFSTSNSLISNNSDISSAYGAITITNNSVTGNIKSNNSYMVSRFVSVERGCAGTLVNAFTDFSGNTFTGKIIGVNQYNSTTGTKIIHGLGSSLVLGAFFEYISMGEVDEFIDGETEYRN